MLWIAKKHFRSVSHLNFGLSTRLVTNSFFILNFLPIKNIYPPGLNNGVKGDEPAFTLATDSWSFYHATHKHWHASNIYEFTLHDVEFEEGTGKPVPSSEPLAKSNKVTFCLIDYVSATKNNGNMGNDNGDNVQRYYWDCESL
jgi:hypothetical protein